MAQIQRQFVCIGYPTAGSAGTIELTPLSFSDNHPADLGMTAIKVFVPALPTLSSDAFWGTAGVCARFEVLIRRVGQ